MKSLVELIEVKCLDLIIIAISFIEPFIVIIARQIFTAAFTIKWVITSLIIIVAREVVIIIASAKIIAIQIVDLLFSVRCLYL